jgi:hypothetical protein
MPSNPSPQCARCWVSISMSVPTRPRGDAGKRRNAACSSTSGPSGPRAGQAHRCCVISAFISSARLRIGVRPRGSDGIGSAIVTSLLTHLARKSTPPSSRVMDQLDQQGPCRNTDDYRRDVMEHIAQQKHLVTELRLGDQSFRNHAFNRVRDCIPSIAVPAIGALISGQTCYSAPVFEPLLFPGSYRRSRRSPPRGRLHLWRTHGLLASRAPQPP